MVFGWAKAWASKGRASTGICEALVENGKEETKKVTPKEREKRRKSKKDRAKQKVTRMSYAKIEKEMNLRYGSLVISEAELEKQLTDTAMKMSRKRQRQVRDLGWVV